MICKICKVEMAYGKAIETWTDNTCRRPFFPPPIITEDNLELIDCWKCPECGHSEELEK